MSSSYDNALRVTTGRTKFQENIGKGVSGVIKAKDTVKSGFSAITPDPVEKLFVNSVKDPLVDKAKKVGRGLLYVLGAPQYALTGATEAVTHGENVFGGIRKGLKEELTPSKVAGIDTSTAAGVGKALALDVATDPLTYLSFGTFSAAKIGGKTLSVFGKKALKKDVLDTLAREKIDPTKIENFAKATKIERNVRLELTKKADAAPDKYYGRLGVGVSIPFTKKSAIAALPSTRIINGMVKVAMKTKAGRAAAPVAKNIDEWFRTAFIGRKMEDVTIDGKTIPASKLTEAFDQMRNQFGSEKSVLDQNIISTAKAGISQFGKGKDGAEFADMVKYVERYAKTSSDYGKAMSDLSKGLRDEVGTGAINEEKAKNIKGLASLTEHYMEIQKNLIKNGEVEERGMVYFARVLKERFGGKRASIGVDDGAIQRKKLKGSKLFVDPLQKGVLFTKKGRGMFVSGVLDEKTTERRVGEQFKMYTETEIGKHIRRGTAGTKKKMEKVGTEIIKADKAVSRFRRSSIKEINNFIKDHSISVSKEFKGKRKEERLKHLLKMEKIKGGYEKRDIALNERAKTLTKKSLEKVRVKISENYVKYVQKRDEAVKQYEKEISSLTEKEIKLVAVETSPEISLNNKKFIKLLSSIEKKENDVLKKRDLLEEAFNGLSIQMKLKTNLVKTAYGNGTHFVKVPRGTLAEKVASVVKISPRVARREEIDEIKGIAEGIFEDASSTFITGYQKAGTIDIVNNILRDFTSVDGLGGQIGMKKMKEVGNSGRLKKPDSGYIDLYKATGGYKPMKGYQIPKDVWEQMKSKLRFMSSADPVHEALQAYDVANGWLKSMMLTGISYVTRNTLGMVWANATAGLKSPALYKEAATLFTKERINKSRGISGGNLIPYTKREKMILDGMNNTNTRHTHFYKVEAGSDITDELKGVKLNPLSSKGILPVATQRAAAYSDDIGRAALFIDRINKGDSFLQAAETVKYYHFDYSDLTSFEQSVMKRLFPFYSWFRKNTPLQIQTLATKPRYAAFAGHAQDVIEPEGADEIRGLMNESQLARSPIILPWKNKNGDYMVVNGGGLLPLYDLTQITKGGTFKLAEDMLSPLFKVPLVELPQNKNLFFGQKINKMAADGENLFMQLLDVPYVGDDQPRNKFLRGIFNDTQAHVISTAYRPLRDLSNFAQLGQEEKDPRMQRVARIMIASARPADVIKMKSFKQYADTEKKKELLKVYSTAVGRYLEGNSPATEKNLEIAGRALVDLGLTKEEVSKEYLKASARQAKYKDLHKIIKTALHEGRRPTGKEIAPIIRAVRNSYKDKSYRRARSVVMEIIKKEYKLSEK